MTTNKLNDKIDYLMIEAIFCAFSIVMYNKYGDSFIITLGLILAVLMALYVILDIYYRKLKSKSNK